MKRFLSYLTILATLLWFSNCAVPGKGPEGGPKDTIPPVVLKEIPKINDTSVATKRVEITFNEYVKIKDAKAFIVSPPLKSQPMLKVRGKRVIVEIDSALNENTTYLFDFGTAIVDLTEGNPLGDYKLRFSTGNVIDTMHISGRALDAFTKDSIKNLKALLYTSDVDSLPFTSMPDAVARVGNRGFFVAEALKNQPYRVIVLEDKNENNKYDADEMIGFFDEMITPVTFQSDTMLMSHYERDTFGAYDYLPQVRMFKENINKQYLSEYKRDEERKVTLFFAQHNPQINSIEFFDANDSTAIVDASKIIVEKSLLGDTITYWFANDSVPRKMHAAINYIRPDSLGNDAPFDANLRIKEFTKIEKKKKKGDEEEKQPSIKLSAKVDEKLVMEKGFDLIFGAPLINMDTKKITLYKFDEKREKTKKIPFKITQNENNLCQYNFQANEWESGTAYEVEFLAGAFTDIYKLTNDSVRQKIETPNPDKFSILRMKITNVKCNCIVQLMKDKRTVVQSKQIDADGIIKFSFIEPGTYRIRVIEDTNNNGRWDIGSLKERRQPERVKIYQLDKGETEIKLKQGWETEQELDAATFFNN